MNETFMLNPAIAEHEKIDGVNFEALVANEFDIPTIEIPDIESSETNESPKDNEDINHKVFKKYFLYIEGADAQINGFLSVLEPAKGKLFTFERRKDAQVIINLLAKKGLETVLLSKSVRYLSKKVK